MKWFIDTEFIESFKKPLFGKRRHYIDLISIGMVSERGDEYYAISKEYNYNDADDWVKENVILPMYKAQLTHIKEINEPSNFHKIVGKSNLQIRRDILKYTCTKHDEYDNLYTNTNPKFYGYFSDYDWVLFCSLFGKMIQLPKGYPMYCIDLKQMMDAKGLNNIWKDNYHPDPKSEHNALEDAKWNMELYQKIIKFQDTPWNL